MAEYLLSTYDGVLFNQANKFLINNKPVLHSTQCSAIYRIFPFVTHLTWTGN
jgi:hypothetical protein